MSDNEIKDLNVYQKVSIAIDKIAKMNLKKNGKNDFAKSSYYLPEDISNAVRIASNELGLLNIFSLKRNEFGIYGELTVVDLEGGENDYIEYQLAIDLPPLKGDNTSMRYGATLTFCKRYMLQNVYEIADNSLVLPPTPPKEPKGPPATPPKGKIKNESGLNYGDFINLNESERCSFILEIINKKQYTRAENALAYCKKHKLLTDKNISDLKPFLNLQKNN